MFHAFVLPILALATSSIGIGLQQGATVRIDVKPEEPTGYADNPSTLATPLRQDLKSLRIDKLADGKTAVRLGADDSPLQIAEIDFSLFVPRVPAIAAKDDDLARFALLQREYNRNEVRFGQVADVEEFKIANNCLKEGLWEVMLDKKVEKGNAMCFHGWFSFPRDEYARVFEKQNGRPLADYEKILAEYPKIEGMNAPLDKLRGVKDESELAVQCFLDEAPIRFGEQKRKAKLVLTPGIETYRAFTDPAKQPIRTARFSEPGLYDCKNPVSFDLRWLATPVNAFRRHVETVQGGTSAEETEIVYANGFRILVADRDLGRLPPRTAAPDNDKDTLRLTFGIGTPDIYASLDERKREQSEDRPNWLFLLGKDGKHVDNHQAGVDRVFVWCEQGEPCKLHLYLVGYERIAVVSHIALPWVKV